MERKIALAHFIKDNDKMFSMSDIKVMKDALKWYGEDDIDDINYEEHLTNIFQMYMYYTYILKLK